MSATDLTFGEMKTELSDRGFNYLSDTRLGYFVNAGRALLDDLEHWPYRLATQTGAAPLTIADLGTIESVTEASQRTTLTWMDRRTLSEAYFDLTTAGSPLWFFIYNGVVRTYPFGGTITVRYWKTTQDLVNASDKPLAPNRFRLLIVDFAAQFAYRDSDNFQAAAALDQAIGPRLDLMREQLLFQQSQDPEMVLLVGESEDW